MSNAPIALSSKSCDFQNTDNRIYLFYNRLMGPFRTITYWYLYTRVSWLRRQSQRRFSVSGAFRIGYDSVHNFACRCKKTSAVYHQSVMCVVGLTAYL